MATKYGHEDLWQHYLSRTRKSNECSKRGVTSACI